MLGPRAEQPYPHSPDLTRARALAAGRFRDGKITVYFRSSGTTNQAQAQIVRQDLINLGFQPDNITMKGFSGGDIYTAWGVRGNGADLGVSMGWCSDYPDSADPAAMISGWARLLADDPPGVEEEAGGGVEARRAGAARGIPPARPRFMRQVAPIAVMRTYNNRYFFSDRVDPKSLVYQGVYQDWSIPALALK